MWWFPHQWNGGEKENMVQGRRNLGRVKQKEWQGKYGAELRDTSLRRSICIQAKPRASLVFPPNTNIQDLNSWFLFTWGFPFILLVCLRKDQWLGWNPYVSRRDRTQINHPGGTNAAAPKHRASTLSCFEKSQPKPKLLSQRCQVEICINMIFLSLLIW